MKRLLALGAIAVVAAGCAAGHTVVRAQPSGERLPRACFGPGRGHQPSPSCNKQWAEQKATQLLRHFRLPRGAQALTREPRGDGGLLRAPAATSASREFVDRRRLWRVQLPLARVEAFVAHEHHAPRVGSGLAGGPGVPANRNVSFMSVSLDGLIASRTLEVTFVALPHGWTGVRADAQVIWVYPRTLLAPPARKGDVIVVRAGSTTRRITDYRTIDRITFRFDVLGVVQPGLYHCPSMTLAMLRPKITIEFHGVHPAATARAVAYGTSMSGPCNPVLFSANGKTVRLNGGHFAQWLEGVLGTRFR